MKRILISALLFTCILAYSQVTVPYRIGNRFGISDASGKMIIPAEYDKIDISTLHPGEFTASKGNTADSFTSTYIYGNKIVLKDSRYNFFNENYSLVNAVKIDNLQGFYSSEGVGYSTTDVYTLDGKKVFDRSFRNVYYVEDDKKPALKDEILVLLNELNDSYSLILLDKKTLKISRTFFENAQKSTTDYNKFPKSFSITYSTPPLSKKKLTINFENGKVKDFSEEAVREERSSSGYGSYSSGSGSYYNETIKPYPSEGTKPQQPLPEMKKISASKKYTEPFSRKKTEINKAELSPNAVLKTVNGKTGFFDTTKNDWIIPAEYDEITMMSTYCAFCSIYIVKKGKHYQILEFNGDEKKLYQAKFEMLPLLEKKNYGKEGFHLIELYDQNGNFFCYADQNGVKFYKQ